MSKLPKVKDPKARIRKKGKEPPHPLKVPAIIGVAVFVAFIITAPFWATDAQDAQRTLVLLGYKPLKVGGFDPFGCGFDIYATKFTAISPQGYMVTGNVCKTPYVSHSSVEIDTEKSSAH